MIIYKRSCDENRRISFLIKEEKTFIKYMGILQKLRDIIKNKFNSKLIYSKKYLKAEKKPLKKSLSMFIYTSTID